MRRVKCRVAEPSDPAIDYGRPEVREYYLALIRELAERDDFDGLELDWMRCGYHFRRGHEQEGLQILTEFTADVRSLFVLRRKTRPPPQPGARVPSRPQTAVGMEWTQLRGRSVVS